MLELQYMEDSEGNELRIMDEIAPRWDQVAIALEVDERFIKILARDCSQNALQACHRMLAHWIDSQSQVNWGFMVDALRRADYKVLAKQVQEARKIAIGTV